MRINSVSAGIAAATIVSLSFVLSCASSGGSSYADTRSSESSAASRARAAQASKSEPPPSSAPPSSAPSDSRNQGGDSGGGLFAFLFGSPSREAAPPVPSGTLAILGLPSGAILFVDGSIQLLSTLSLPVGEHEVRVSRFGYEDYLGSSTIIEGARAELKVELAPAPFSVRGVEPGTEAFDPGDPGFLGGCEILLEATAAGSAQVAITDAQDRLVRRLPAATIRQERTLLRWDGRDEQGHRVAPGDYRILVEALGEDGVSSRAEAGVSVERGLFVRSTSLYSGVSGAMFAPDARVLPSGGAEFEVGALGHLVPSQSGITGRATAQAGLRLGLGGGPSGTGYELDLSTMGIFHPGDPEANQIDAFEVTGALKYAFITGPESAAIYAKATWSSFYDPAAGGWPSDWDGPTRFGGLSVGLPIEEASDNLRLFVAPELQSSTFFPGYGTDLSWNVPGFFVWAYLRGGFEVTIENLSFAVSGALRSQPFTGAALALRQPASVGAEIRWHSPSSPLIISFLMTGEIRNSYDYYLSSGIGVGLRL